MGHVDSSPHINVQYLCVQPADREGESDGPKNERNEKELETEMLYPIGGWMEDEMPAVFALTVFDRCSYLFVCFPILYPNKLT